VAILDADREGFLRSERSLIQTAGRAARNADGEVLMYADKVTRSMDLAIRETDRRRKRQLAYNIEHGIIPRTITKTREEILQATLAASDRPDTPDSTAEEMPWDKVLAGEFSPRETIDMLHKAMQEAAKALEFEKAAALRDRMDDMKAQWGLGT